MRLSKENEVTVMDVEQKLIQEIRSHGNIQVICRLCDAIENLNGVVAVPTMDGSHHTFSSTFLSMAISCDNLEAVEALLQKGVDPNYIDSRLMNEGPLLHQLSIFTGKTAEDAKKALQITKLMLDHGADPNQIIPGEGKTVYQYAQLKASLAYDPSSDYDYRYDGVFLELLEARIHGTLNLIDMEDLLSSFDD